jgi:protein SCO1/2
MLLGFALANLALIAAAYIVVSNRPLPPPQIQGVLLLEGRELEAFTLLDHHNQAFANEDLLGRWHRWHLVSYGFTTCPDICPTTLVQLNQLVDRLGADGASDLRVLFYSIDHRRDTVSQMAGYVPYFNPKFVGLTHEDDPDNPHLPFEQSLGIMSQLSPILDEDGVPDPDNYTVSHGVTLFLINPEGELQAVFEPDEPAPGVHHFDPDKLFNDYTAVRDYLG